MAATFSRSLWLLVNAKGSSQETIARYQFLVAWRELVDEYSDLQLTYGMDKLPGISGLARAASLFFPGRYLSGIWEYTLSSGLLWVPKRRPVTLVEGECAPSWTWASTTEAVRSSGAVSLDGTAESRITLEHVSTSSNGSKILFLSGQLQRCYVSLTSEPKPVIRRQKDAWETEAHIDSYRFWPTRVEDSENGYEEARNVCHFDGNRGSLSEYFFLRLECSKTLAFQHCRGLLLIREDVTADQFSYTWVGVGWSSDSSWHTVPRSVVQLM
jgi:hypothetical protein